MNNPFAVPTDGPSPWQFENPGMTLRDYFAAKAMATCIYICKQDNRPAGITYEQYVAAHAYDMADAMLKAREAMGDE